MRTATQTNSVTIGPQISVQSRSMRISKTRHGTHVEPVKVWGELNVRDEGERRWRRMTTAL